MSNVAVIAAAIVVPVIAAAVGKGEKGGKRKKGKKGENPPKGKGEKVYTARDHLLCSCSCGYSCGDFLIWAWKKGEKRGEKGREEKRGKRGKSTKG